MMLSTLTISDSFAKSNRIDLTCSHCGGNKAVCSHCHGEGVVPLRGGRVYDTGFPAGKRFDRTPVPGVVAFVYQGNIWMGLSNPGVRTVPTLALAWTRLFPKCQWMPDQFVDTNNLSIYAEELGEKAARTLLSKVRDALQCQKDQAQADLEKIDKYLAEH